MGALSAVLSVLALAQGSPDPGPQRPSPDGRFQAIIHRVSELEPASGGSRITGSMTTTVTFDLRTHEGASGRVARLVVDSLHVSATDAALLVAPTGTQPLRGAWVEFALDGTRASGSPARSLSHLALRELDVLPPLLFPGWSVQGAPAWSDTVVLDDRARDFLKSGRRISRYHLEAVSGGAHRILGAVEEESEMANWGHQVSSSCRGTGDRVIEVSPAGRITRARARLTSRSTQSGNGIATVTVEVELTRR